MNAETTGVAATDQPSNGRPAGLAVGF